MADIEPHALEASSGLETLTSAKEVSLHLFSLQLQLFFLAIVRSISDEKPIAMVMHEFERHLSRLRLQQVVAGMQGRYLLLRENMAHVLIKGTAEDLATLHDSLERQYANTLRSFQSQLIESLSREILIPVPATKRTERGIAEAKFLSFLKEDLIGVLSSEVLGKLFEKGTVHVCFDTLFSHQGEFLTQELEIITRSRKSFNNLGKRKLQETLEIFRKFGIAREVTEGGILLAIERA